MQNKDFVTLVGPVMERFYADLAALVNIDSGTYLKAGVDQVVAYLERRFREFGFVTQLVEQEEYGNHLVATHEGSAQDGPRLLFIGHTDTVFPQDEALRRPFSYSEQAGLRIAKGPGVLDMKSGLLMGLYALHLLIEAGTTDYRSVTFVCNSDEEVGSPSSKPLIERLAREADAVLVFEPGRALNRFVSARKGVANYRVEAHGLSSHAGVEPDKGRNAIVALAYQVLELQALNATIPGVTLNVGIICGGARTNIVPDYAYCDIDVRVSDQAGLHAIEEALRRVTMHTHVDGTVITLTGGVRSMPFELTPANQRLVELVKAAGRTLGLTLEDVASGGGSDANTTSALGCPTVDGLGAGGGLAHNPDEYVELDYLPLRLALICEVVRYICNYYQDGWQL
ncbi:peptidase M20 [Ktedonobacteria bacterium brp13]|nr:peptidase M20 [Ktedonobacteria bacterium brp13]